VHLLAPLLQSLTLGALHQRILFQFLKSANLIDDTGVALFGIRQLQEFLSGHHTQDGELHPQNRPAARCGEGAVGVQKGGGLPVDVPVSSEGGLPAHPWRGAGANCNLSWSTQGVHMGASPTYAIHLQH